MTRLKEIELPKITKEQRIAFAILCVKIVSIISSWNNWADNWLNNIDRSYKTANSARIIHDIDNYYKDDFDKYSINAACAHAALTASALASRSIYNTTCATALSSRSICGAAAAALTVNKNINLIEIANTAINNY